MWIRTPRWFPNLFKNGRLQKSAKIQPSQQHCERRGATLAQSAQRVAAAALQAATAVLDRLQAGQQNEQGQQQQEQYGTSSLALGEEHCGSSGLPRRCLWCPWIVPKRLQDRERAENVKSGPVERVRAALWNTLRVSEGFSICELHPLIGGPSQEVAAHEQCFSGGCRQL